jgi:ubiquinone/menaquinone biosynthesis C-methylase UbiE
MLFPKKFASQLINPSGFFGRFMLPHIWNLGNRILNNLVFEQLDLQPNDRVLEIGFGGGYLLRRIRAEIKQGLVAGVDLSPLMIARFKRRRRFFFRDGHIFLGRVRAEASPFISKSFTKVCTINTLFFLKDVQQVLFEMHRILAENGTAIVCFTDQVSLKTQTFVRYGLRLFEPEEVQKIMEPTGFKHVRMIHAREGDRGFYCVVGIK